MKAKLGEDVQNHQNHQKDNHKQQSQVNGIAQQPPPPRVDPVPPTPPPPPVPVVNTGPAPVMSYRSVATRKFCSWNLYLSILLVYSLPRLETRRTENKLRVLTGQPVKVVDSFA